MQNNGNLAEQELSDFSYIVSHDLTASFRQISEFSKLVRQEIGPDASGAVAVFGDQLQEASDRCGRMMDQLLAFSRAQQKVLKFRRCDATRLMEMATLQLSAEVRAADAEISIESLGEIVGDSDLIILAFKHALSNAIKFSRPHQAPRVDVRGSETPDAHVIQIADNGIGVAIDRQERMFRMFYRDQREGEYPGVGAGLAICRRILRRHGGDAQFIAAPVGACLEITMLKIIGFELMEQAGDSA